MKRLFKWILRLVLLLMAVAAVLVLFRNPIARALIERQIRAETGMETVIGRVSIGLKSPTLRLLHVRLLNTPEFGGQLFADLPDLYVEYDLLALAFGRIRGERVMFRLDELRLLRDAQGVTNLQRLGQRLRERGLAERLERLGLSYGGIDTLSFSLGRIKYVDLREPPRSEEIYVGSRHVSYRQPRSVAEVLAQIGQRAKEKGSVAAANELIGGGSASR
jgi:uncharacterized protein involved in outer membrane biogenesis